MCIYFWLSIFCLLGHFFWHCYSEAELPLGLISRLMTLISDILKGKISLNVDILQMILKTLLLKEEKKSISEVGLYGVLLPWKRGLCCSSFWFKTWFAWTCLKAAWKIQGNKSAMGAQQSGARCAWLCDVVFEWVDLNGFIWSLVSKFQVKLGQALSGQECVSLIFCLLKLFLY